MIERHGHIVELQSIRGVAALVVLVGHTLSYAQTPLWSQSLLRAVNGHAAVVLFFVLSGFVLTRSLKASLDNISDVLRFYMRRIFRIYPALWFASLIGMAYIYFMHFQYPVEGVSDWFNNLYLHGTIGFLYRSRGFLGTAHLLPPGWSIFVEIVASGILPLLAWSLYRRRQVFWMLFIALLLTSFLNKGSPYAVLTYLVDFAIGAYLAALSPGWRSAIAKLRPGQANLAFAAAILLLVVPRFFWRTYYDDPTLQMVESIGAAGIIVLIVYSRLDVPALRTPSMLLLGDISFSIYLLHWPMMCIMAKLIAQLYTPGDNSLVFSLLLMAATLMITLPLSWLSYTYIELPGIRLGRWAESGIFQAKVKQRSV